MTILEAISIEGFYDAVPQYAEQNGKRPKIAKMPQYMFEMLKREIVRGSILFSIIDCEETITIYGIQIEIKDQDGLELF